MTERSVVGRVAALALVLVLGIASCGGGGGGSDGDDASEAERTTTTTARDVDADLAAARAGLLRLSDLPDGWVEAEADAEEDDDDGLTVQLAECLDVDPALLATPDNPTNAESPDFSDPESGASVSNSIAYTESVARAQEVLEIFGQAELPSCLSTIMTELLGKELPAGMTFGTIDVKRLAMDSDADETMAIRVHIPIEAEGTTIDQYLDMVLARVGRAGITLTFSSTGPTVPADFEQTVVGIVVSRVRGEDPEPTDEDEGEQEGTADEAATDQGGTGGVRPMAAETEGERAALAAAATPEGRRWGAGAPEGTGAAATGQPFLGGYVVHLTDGSTSYQVRVLNRRAVPFFGLEGIMAIVAPFAPGVHATAPPETQAQADAITAAVVSLGAEAERIETGGIELYSVYFAPPDGSSYFHVDIYADASVGSTFAQGGPETR